MTNQPPTGILAEAANLIIGDRQQTYGPPTDSMRAIARLWTAYLDNPITAEQVAHMMTLLKISRASQGSGTRDNYVDAAAYQEIAAQCASASADSNDRPEHILVYHNDETRECVKCARTWAVGEPFSPKELCNG